MNTVADVLVADVLHSLIHFRSANVFNPWKDIDPLDVDQEGAAYQRVTRLMMHFTIEAPRLLMIGEAPGYQGCHFSGVPFTNESLLMRGAIPRMISHGPRLTTREKPWCEPSATIVWETLHRLRVAESTVLWNAYAWHPHKPGEPMSNRAPTRAELKSGAEILRNVVAAFPGAYVIAVGNVAESALSYLGIKPDAKVRHPSMGGATQFRQQMAEIVGA